MSDMNPGNDDLEKALRASLRREPAPPNFAARVIAKAAITPRPVARKTWLQRPFTLALAASLAALAIVPAVVFDYQRREEARGMKAKRDLLMALAITRDQLQHAREKVRSTTRIAQ